MEMPENMRDFFKELKIDRTRIEQNIPKVAAAKKIKFLKAIGAADQLDASASQVNMDDENLDIREKYGNLCRRSRETPIPFDDSIVINAFMDIKRPDFDLKTYVLCVKRLYHSSLINQTDLCYLLCHARDFSEPRNMLLTFSVNGTKTLDLNLNDATVQIAKPSPFTAKLMSLMDDLLVNYSEAKYQQLNLNVTYLALLLTRKLFKGKASYMTALNKSKTHEDFVGLCRRALCSRLPDDEPLGSSEVCRQRNNTLVILVLYGYTNSSRQSRRVLETACLGHMRYTGLDLPEMFDRLVQLYKVPEGRLWDALAVDKQSSKSLFKLADFHDSQRRGESETPPKTYALFPYCRVLQSGYHCDLSCKNNELVCYAMAYLIDTKIGVEKSHMTKAHWAREMERTILAAKAKNLAAHVNNVLDSYSQ